MANKGKYFATKPISLVQQKVALCANFKDSTCSIDKAKNQIFWSGKVKPSPLSKEYTVVLLYQLKKSPKVWVIGDELENLDSPDFPHKFDIDAKNKMVQICLYRHAEFNSGKLLATTIIPWAIEWLYYYELWLATDSWIIDDI